MSDSRLEKRFFRRSAAREARLSNVMKSEWMGFLWRLKVCTLNICLQDSWCMIVFIRTSTSKRAFEIIQFPKSLGYWPLFCGAKKLPFDTFASVCLRCCMADEES